ncbi:hypothetical protein Tco_0599132 [Tanacetum coccineum]
MGGSYYPIPCSILSTGKDRKTPQRYPDVPTTSWRIFIRSMDSFQGLTPVSAIITLNKSKESRSSHHIKSEDHDQDKESSAAGTDNRPPMLVESDYESWKIRIERYIRVTEGEGDAATQVTRDKWDEEFTEIENNKELADIQATNILSQGLPRHVFNILNQTRTRKEIWDNVELLMKGSGKSLQQQKEELFD